jgi:hypothetical protein
MANKKKHPLRASAIKFELSSKSAGSLRGSDYIRKKEFYLHLSFSGTERDPRRFTFESLYPTGPWESTIVEDFSS